MPLNSLTPVFLPHYQSFSNPPISLCNSTSKRLLLAQLFCGMPPQSSPHVPSINQHITDGTFYCLCSSRQISLSRMEQLINQLLDPQLFCRPFSNFRRIVSRLFTKPSNSSTNNWRHNISTDRHYNSLSFNCKMTLPYCATCSSPTGLSPLKTPLPVLYLTLTLLQLHNCFLALRNLLFVVLPRWSLRDHPERKQKILQTPISSPHPTRRKSSNYGAKLHIKNLQTRKTICKWNSNLYIYHCGHSLSIVFLIW